MQALVLDREAFMKHLSSLVAAALVVSIMVPRAHAATRARIVFEGSGQGYANGIYMMNADGSNLHAVITTAADTFASPQFTLDDARILFTHDEAGGNLGQQVYVVNPDGSGLRALTSAPVSNSL